MEVRVAPRRHAACQSTRLDVASFSGSAGKGRGRCVLAKYLPRSIHDTTCRTAAPAGILMPATAAAPAADAHASLFCALIVARHGEQAACALAVRGEGRGRWCLCCLARRRHRVPPMPES
eukprot:351083-Chlamydomonas_euryale.AAC.5